MKYTQFFILEAGSSCNLAERHCGVCPANDCRRWEGLDTSRSLTAELMASLAIDAYNKHGFSGFVGFHYYNEPTLRMDLIKKMSLMVLQAVPGAKFMLWTNGKMLHKLPDEDIKIFTQIHITNYDNEEFGRVKSLVRDVQVRPPHMDDRISDGKSESTEGCYRPFVEIDIDYHGYVHLCCIAWRGKEVIGNVFDEPFEVILGRFQGLRKEIAKRPMGADSPEICKNCHERSLHIPEFIPEISVLSIAEVSGPSKVDQGRRRKFAREARLKVSEIKARRRNRAAVSVPEPSFIIKNNDACEIEEYAAKSGMKWMKTTVVPQRTDVIYGLVGTWYEEDIIEACVKNLFRQGVERVFILDDNSPDDTLARAIAAGAEVGECYKSATYSDGRVTVRMNRFIDEITKKSGIPRLWWLISDADEFICGPDGKTVKDIVATVPDDVDCIGSVFFDYFPEGYPANTRGVYPGEFQKRGMMRLSDFCDKKHYKHNLFLTRNGVASVLAHRGRHSLIIRNSAVSIKEADLCLLTHHFMFRNENHTRKQLAAICAPVGRDGTDRYAEERAVIGDVGANLKYRNLDKIYSGRWSEVEIPHAQRRAKKVGIAMETPGGAGFGNYTVLPFIKSGKSFGALGPAVVLVHYRIPQIRLDEHFRANKEQYVKNNVTVFVVSDSAVLSAPDYARILVYPRELKTFSLAKTANYGVRAAIEAGHQIVIKSDSDVALGDVGWLLSCGPKEARAPKYISVPAWESVGGDGRVMPDGEGTISMRYLGWLAVQGYNEILDGWGFDDNEICQKLSNIGWQVNHDGRVWHVDHPGGAKWNRAFNPDRGRENMLRGSERIPNPDWGMAD